MSDGLRSERPCEGRLRWIETWAKGWSLWLTEGGDRSDVTYEQMPLDVATSMILELVEALRDPLVALDLLARESMESGQEIGEAVEARRA